MRSPKVSSTGSRKVTRTRTIECFGPIRDTRAASGSAPVEALHSGAAKSSPVSAPARAGREPPQVAGLARNLNRVDYFSFLFLLFISTSFGRSSGGDGWRRSQNLQNRALCFPCNVARIGSVRWRVFYILLRLCCFGQVPNGQSSRV